MFIAGHGRLNMSGGASKKKSGHAQGWEQAGDEFYQESYPSTEGEFEVLQKDPKHLATLLPSKQTRQGTSNYVCLRLISLSFSYFLYRPNLY